MIITYDFIKSVYAKYGYRFYDSGPYNVNNFAIRRKLGLIDEFNDVRGIAYIDDLGNKQCLVWPCTTVPGLYWLKNHMGNVKGTFIVQPGQYPGVWMIGEHKGYEALVQVGIFNGWRDNDDDGELDMTGPTFTDGAGVNDHTTSFINNKDKIGAYSAGCMVTQDDKDHLVKMAICKKSAELYGGIDRAKFTFTLFEEK